MSRNGRLPGRPPHGISSPTPDIAFPPPIIRQHDLALLRFTLEIKLCRPLPMSRFTFANVVWLFGRLQHRVSLEARGLPKTRRTAL